MKKHLLLLITLFPFYNLAQTSVYHPFPDSNAVWRETRGVNGSMFIYQWEEEKFMNGDTVIGGNTYHKIYESGFYSEHEIIGFNIIDSYYYYGNFIGVIRQDTNRKVFTYNTDLNQDELLYDFNWQIGDTIPITYNHPASMGDTLFVTGIDSIFDGTNYRNRYLISQGIGIANYTSIIEGIGSDFGLFTIIDPPFEAGGALHCFTQNGTVKYTDSSMYACDWISNVSENPQKIFSPEIYPNPFSASALLLVSPEFENAEMKIYNSFGLLLREERLSNQIIFALDCNEFPGGMYFLEIINDNGQMASQKFLIIK